ncbi:uncharacterized protein LOC143627499 [Bidens hawaiensis]|uniref:uncharacterized protein LOC143627499 n=1 Tax=Bidens hawaiensis TaxID=980011 RepID=UPI0040496DFC
MDMMSSGYNIKDLIQEAQIRWLRPGEVFFILQNYEETQLCHELPQKPPSGSLFLFNKRVLRYFRKDGHNWRRKKDGRTVVEAHERLKVGNAEALNCYYAHGEQNPSFQRRCYWMLDQGMDHIVLVHYRDIGIRMASGHSSGSISTFSSGSSTITQGSNSDASQFTQSAAAFSQFPELCDSKLSSSYTEVSSNVVARSYVAGPLGLTQEFEKIGGSPDLEINQASRRMKEELYINEDSLKDTSAFDIFDIDLSQSIQDFYSTLESRSSLQEQEFFLKLSKVIFIETI